MNRRLALAALLVSCGSAAGAPAATPTWERTGLGGAVRPEMGSPQPGELAPEMSLPDLEGRTASLAAMRGSWVVLHFTATWCPFCDSEIAHLGELADAFGERGVRTVVVDVEEDAAVWSAYAKGHVAPSVIALHDATGRAAAQFAPPRAQPSFEDRAEAVLDATLIVDPAGTIRLFLLPDSAHFDPTFGGVRAELERLVPQPVVRVSVGARTIAAGERAELDVKLVVARGYHVMSDRPSAQSYVATRVEVEAASAGGVRIADPRYPSPSFFAIGERAIATFEGAVDVRLPIEVAADAAPGPRRLQGMVRYQACTATRCLFPASQAFAVPLVIGAVDGR